MLLSPFNWPELADKRERARIEPSHLRPTVRAKPPEGGREGASAVPAILTVWLVLGAGFLLLAPSARGGRPFGATLPFWLVGAPLIDLLWWKRHAALAALQKNWQVRRRRAAAVRYVVRRRQRG